MNDLDTAEILYETGEVRFRYARYLSKDGARWIRQGLFGAYHPNGTLASEGHYVDGSEHGLWRDYHDNAQLAAKENFESGKEVGEWHYWNSDGSSAA